MGVQIPGKRTYAKLRPLINQILHQESSSLPSGNIHDAMHEIINEIIPRGILPALRVGNFWFKKTGILDDKDGSVCLKCSIPQILIGPEHWLDTKTLEILPEIPFLCTGQDFFPLLCTTIVEAILFGMVYWTTVHKGYVFSFDSSMVQFLPYDALPEHSLIHACKFCHS